MLVEKSRLVEVTAEVKNDAHTYDVTYKTNGNTLVKVEVGVNKKITEDIDTATGKQSVTRVERIGFMSCEPGSKNVNIRNGEEIAPHAVLFEQILAEITALLSAPVKASK